jgi:hypothetical protein
MSDNPTYDKWLPISEKARLKGIARLSDSELTLHTCFRFVCLFNNGGLDGYGYNTDAQERAATACSLRRIGADACAHLLDRANSLLDTYVPLGAADTWEQFLAVADPQNELDEIHESLSREIESEDLHSKVDELAARLDSST